MGLSVIESANANQTNITNNKVAFSVKDLADMTGMSKAYYRDEIRARRLRAKLFGTRVRIMCDDWIIYVKNQKDWSPKSENEGEENDEK